MIVEKIDKFLNENKKFNKKDYLYKSSKGKDGYFVVVKRNTYGMKGPQDDFLMYVVDDKDKVIKEWGSHPSLNGAKGFGENKGYKE